MMRKVFSVALAVALFGLVQSANAGVTVDVVFQDAILPTGITISPGDVGPGCAFTGFNGGSTPTGRCMDVMLMSTEIMVGLGASVLYDNDNGLAIQNMYEWKGPGVVFSRGVPVQKCGPAGGLVDVGPGEINSFDCIISPPNAPPSLIPGTYRLGTIVWDTSATTAGTETISAYINDLFDGVASIINGNRVTLRQADIVVRSHILTIVPEPGTVSLLGLGLVGLVLAGRRSRA